MKNILSYLGFNKEISPRLSRLDSLSIVSRQSVLAVLAVFLTMFSGTALADYTVTFNTSGSVGIASGGSYVNSTETTGYLTYSEDGMQFGSGGQGGSYEMTMTSSGTYIGQIQATKISLSGLKKPSSKGGNLNYTITFTDASTITNSVTTSTSESNPDISLTSYSSKTIQKIKFYASTKEKRFYLKGFTVVAAAATCTLHHGSGGSSTTNMTQGSGTLPSGNAVTGWTFSHWSTSQQTTPSASTPGTRYNSGVTTPAQANLYAFYVNDCNSLYCTAPTAVYHIVNMGPAVSGGDDDDYFYTTVGGNDNVFCNITSGTTVYLTGHIGTGHSFHEWHVTKTDDASTTVTVTNPTAYDGTAYFTMPSYNVDIDAEFCRSLNGEDITVAQVTTKTSTEIEWECEDAKYYEVAIKNPEGAYIYRQNDWVTALGTGITIDTLRPATTYRLQISAINACQETNSSKRSNTYDEYFTTPGHTVTYSQAGEDVTTSVPVDASSGTYGNSASVTLLDKNSDSHKADYYFAGWTDNSSGTGTVYKPGDTYTITGNVTFYAKWVACSAATTPSSLSVSGSGTPNVTFSWDAVDGATKYQLVLMDGSSSYYEFETTSTSKTINISEVGDEGEYMGQIRACNGTIGYCYEDFDDIEFAEGCPNYSFHFGTDKGSDWNDPADYCFVKSTSDGNGGYFYLLEDFTMPAKPDFYLGWQGSFDGTNAKSKTLGFGTIPFDLQRTKTIGTYDGGNTQGAIGILRIRSSYGDDNRYIGFIPGGYVLRLGTDGTGWTSYAFTAASANYYETVWTTDIMTLTAGILGGNAYVGLKTSDSYVWNSTYSESIVINGNMGRKSGTSTWGSNLSSSNDVGKRGKFRIWADNTAKNWNLHFVPYHRIIFHANYPVGVSPADTYSVDVSVEETNSSISLNSAPSAPTGYTFDGWYDAATGGTKRTGNQTISAGASADTELYAHWAPNTHSVNYSLPSNGDYTISVAGGAATSATKNADYGQTVTLAATPNTGYEFTSWDVYKTGESGTKVTVTSNQFTMPDYDVTVTASFTAINYNVTYSAPTNGNYTIKVASGSASSATKTANYGQTITLAATPSEGYQLSSWTIKNTSTSADVTGSVSLSSSTTSPATFTMPAYGVTVIATFGARNYTLTWDWNGGETSSTTHTAAGSVAYGTTIVYPANGTMSKEGHTFTGWSSTPATMPASNTTITAQWSVNSYNVAVANVDHVAITATPASELAIGEGSNRDVNYGKSVTLAYSSLESKNYWGGWKVTNAGGDDVTASVVDGNTLTVPDYAVTVSAVTYGNLVAWCDPQVTVSDGFCLTSYYVSGAASTTNSVYTTSAAGNLLTINSTDLGSVDKIEFSYLDGSDNTVTLTSSPFRLCNDGSSNYNVADGGAGSSYTKTGLSNTCDLSYSIRYKPTAYNLMDNYKLKMVFKKGTEVRKTIIREMNGRSLPEEFVIAAKFNGQWYALPNTLKGTQAEQGAITPVKITVDNTTTPTAATYAPTTTVYKGRAKYETSNPSSMALTSTGSNYLQTSNSVNQMWLSSSGYTGAVDWYFKSSDRSVYELAMDPVNTPTKKMGIDGGHMGYYAKPTISAIYLLPITNKIVDNPAIVTAWGQQSVILDVDAQTASSASAHLGVGDSEKAASFGETKTSVKNANSKYNYTLSFNTMDFSAHKGELLYVDWLDGDDNVVSTSTLTIPWIIAESSVMGEIDNVQAHWNDWEVHVLPGVTLEADGNSFSEASNVAKIKTLEIYPGATVNVTTGTLGVTNLIMRNGWNRLNGDKKYDVARLYITPSAGSLTATNVYADWYIDYDQYYPIAVPWKVTTAGITYLNTSNAASAGVKLRHYDGAGRVTGANGSAAVGANWVELNPWPETLDPSKGYAMTARRPTGKAFSIVRMPLTIPSAAWTTGGEKGSVTVGAVTTHKDQVEVTAHGADDPSKPEYVKGWNFIANPYMALHQGELSYTDAGTIVYANIPDVNFKEYDQVPIATTKLKPASGFLVQAPKTGTVTFGETNRKAAAPSYRTEAADETPVQRAYITLANEEAEDMMGILVADKYTEAYEMNADLEKLLSDGNTLRTYMRYGDMNMAYVAINEMLAKEWIPVSVRIPADGEYTFSLHEASIAGELEGVYLIDYQNGDKITNLIEQSYTFSSTAGTINGRFAINAKVGERQTPTGIDAINAGGDINSDKPFKFIYHDKVYIWLNGVIYDTTGKRVK